MRSLTTDTMYYLFTYSLSVKMQLCSDEMWFQTDPSLFLTVPAFIYLGALWELLTRARLRLPQSVAHVVILVPQVHHKSLSLGEVLDGDRMAESLYHIRFRENVEKKTLCQLTLSEKQVCCSSLLGLSTLCTTRHYWITITALCSFSDLRLINLWSSFSGV